MPRPKLRLTPPIAKSGESFLSTDLLPLHLTARHALCGTSTALNLLCTDRYPGNDPAPGLDGSLPGDYGFDPIGFIADEESKRWYQQAELIHSR